VPLVGYFTLRLVRDGVDAASLRWLSLLQVWRIPAALVFFCYGAKGALRPRGAGKPQRLNACRTFMSSDLPTSWWPSAPVSRSRSWATRAWAC
jgi:hypothetical protein